MNKTLLLIICDFLLLSLIGFIEVRDLDINESTRKDNYNKKAGDDLKRQAELIDLLESSLAFEKAGREKLTQSLEEEREILEDTENAFAEEKNVLLQNLSETQEALIGTEQKRYQLEEQVILLDQQSSAYQEKLKRLQDQLQLNKSIIAEYEERLAEIKNQSTEKENMLQALKTDLAVKETENTYLKTQLEDQKQTSTLSSEKIERLEKEQLKTLQDKQLLFAELKALEAEKQKIEEMLSYVQTEADANRIEKQTLEKIVDTTKILEKTIDKNIILSPHTIFQNFQTNKADIQFIIKDNRNRNQSTTIQPAVIIRHDQRLYALLHTHDTPLEFTRFRSRWPDALSVFIRNKDSFIAVETIQFLKTDPRVIVIPVPKYYEEKLADNAFTLAQTPFSFTKTVLISNNQSGNYGETQFKIDLAGEEHLKMLRKPFSRLLGIFTPDKSDFVFSQSGNLIGIMVNRNYCVLIKDFTTIEALNINQYTKQEGEQAQLRLSERIEQLPAVFR